MSASLGEIIEAAEQAVAGGEDEKRRLDQLLADVDVAAIGGPESRAYLAVLLDWLGRRQQAILALRPADDELGESSAAAPNLAGMLAARHGDYQQALALFMRAIAGTRDGTPLRAKIKVNLAALSLLAGDTVAASAWLALATDAARQFSDPATDVLLASIAIGIARERGDLPRQRAAVARLNEATRARVAELGPDHPLALTALASLAAADFELAVAEEQTEHQERSVAVLEVAAHRLAADLGADHPYALACAEDLCVAELHLALASASMDRVARAVHALESLSRRTVAAVGEGHPRARTVAAMAASARQALETARAGTAPSLGRELSPAGDPLRRSPEKAPAEATASRDRELALAPSGKGDGKGRGDQPAHGNRARAPKRRRRPDKHLPWSRGQVRVVDSWPTRRNQPVSVALSPTGGRLALCVGQRVSVSVVSGGPRAESPLPVACALVPGLAWSPDGNRLAFRDEDGQGRVIDLSVPGGEERTVTLGAASAMAFAPDGDRLALLAPSLAGRMTLRLVRPGRVGANADAFWERALPRSRTSNYSEGVNLAWSPDGRRLACTTGTSTVWVIDAASGRPTRQFDDHSATVTGLSWIDDERILSASADATLQVWHPDDAAPVTVVETIAAAGMAFVRDRGIALVWSAGGELLAWSLAEAPAQLWYRDPLSRSVAAHFSRLAVSAAGGLLALVDAGTTELLLVRDWDRADSAPAATTTYANAKVLLLGDSGVGKSGLAMVLAGKEFQETESTYGRQIWQITASEDPESIDDYREVLLWDLAGQPGYRIVHQLNLDGAAAALILCDPKSETEPLAGARHWARAVRHAYPVSAGGLSTFLVAARTDRSGIIVSDKRIAELMADFRLDTYFQTSAKEGEGTDQLRTHLLAAIDWEKTPKITSTALFSAVRQFVVHQRSSGSVMIPADELCRLFQITVPDSVQLLTGHEQEARPPIDDPPEDPSAVLTSVFEGCIARLESAGLVKRLKFGDYVLLQPELLDAYAGDIVNAAREEPDGLGSILESRVVNLDFGYPVSGRVPEKRLERLLVFATVEELLQHELALREPTEDGVQLIFPSAHRRDLPPSETPGGDGVVFRFEGPIDNIYATLIVRLARSNVFRRLTTWQSAARFAAGQGECTVFLKYDGEGKAELWIGYDRVPDPLREQFERFVHRHLDQRALPGTVTRERQYSCPHDGIPFTSEQVGQVLLRGRDSILCPVCENRIPLRDDYELVAGADPSAAAMEASADAGREIAAASAVLRGKEEVAEFDVFLCHQWEDKPAVRKLAQQLRERGLRPWFDEDELRPGIPWQPALEGVIASIPAAAVIVGPRGVGPWQDRELGAFLGQFIGRQCPVVPVLLPGARRLDLPVFLDGLTWVDLTETDPDPLDRLEWGITGRQPNR